MFNFRSETIPNISMLLRADNKYLSEPSRIIVVSLVNYVILYTSEPIFKPFCFIVYKNRICAQIINRYDAIRSPCLHPLSIFMNSDRKPVCSTVVFILLLNNLIHLMKSGPKLRWLSTLHRNFQETESKAF